MNPERTPEFKGKYTHFPKYIRQGLRPLEVESIHQRHLLRYVSMFEYNAPHAFIYMHGRPRISMFLDGNVKDVTKNFPELHNGIKALEKNLIIEGQIVFQNGLSDLERTVVEARARMKVTPAGMRELNPLEVGFIANDLLYEEAFDLRSVPFMERYRRLQRLIPTQVRKKFNFVPNLIEEEQPGALLKVAKDYGYPGVNFRLREGLYHTKTSNPKRPPWLFIATP